MALLALIVGPAAAIALAFFVISSHSLVLSYALAVAIPGLFGFLVAGAAGWRGAKQQVVALAACLIAFVATSALAALFFWKTMHYW